MLEIPDLGQLASPASGPVGIHPAFAPPRRHIPDTDLWVYPLALGAQRFGRTIDPRTEALLELHGYPIGLAHEQHVEPLHAESAQRGVDTCVDVLGRES
ncbi:hypothetical protein ACC691_37610, partial [Rhizobium johnstonii]|uniref:hypothetical protein n=1 Tax=Rhizobium johnstonii TaxID=3019933 RepID=UPI003F983E32